LQVSVGKLQLLSLVQPFQPTTSLVILSGPVLVSVDPRVWCRYGQKFGFASGSVA